MAIRPRRGRSFRSVLHALSRVCRGPLRQGVRQTEADRYVKRHRSVEFALGLICHFLLGLPSLRQLRLRLSRDGHLKRHVHLDRISDAQLPKLLHARPSELWAPLVTALLARLSRQHAPSCLRIMDSSFFAMSVRLFSRCQEALFAPEAAGVKLGVVLDPARHAPVHWQCRVGQGSDNGLLDALVPPSAPIEGLLFLFDRGFRCHAFFQRLLDRQAHFVTRAVQNTHWELLGSFSLDPAHPEIVADQRVRLGSHNGHNRMKSPVRRIVLNSTPGPVIFLTSRFDLPAVEVAELYRRRWEIEVFFRWLKSVLRCRKPLGYSASAGEHTLCAAIVAYLLTILFADVELSTQTGRLTARVKRALTSLQAALFQRPRLAQLRALGFH